MMSPPVSRPKSIASPKPAARLRAPVRPLPPWQPRSQAFGAQPATRLSGFPHRTEIGERLGRSFSAPSVVDPEGCARRGVPAFTIAGQVHFGSPHPALNVAAHEAAHVLQQEGVTRDMGLGAERHATAVEHIVASGGDARLLIGARGARLHAGPHFYTVIDTAAQTAAEWNAGADLRVSEDGLMALKDNNFGSHDFWAEASKILASDRVLTRAKAGIRLQAAGAALTGSSPVGGTKRTLVKVAAKNEVTGTQGTAMTLVADCGEAARTVMGANAADTETRAVYKKARLKGQKGAVPYSTTSAAASDDPNKMEDEVLKGATGAANTKKARAEYFAMTDAQREAFDKRTGINKYAKPGTGEAYAISTGPVERAQDWNFHWGGVVMTSGSDRVTLENWANEAKPTNSAWEFQMYGSAAKAGQTFHEQHKATDMHGTTPVTMSVRRRKTG